MDNTEPITETINNPPTKAWSPAPELPTFADGFQAGYSAGVARLMELMTGGMPRMDASAQTMRELQAEIISRKR